MIAVGAIASGGMEGGKDCAECRRVMSSQFICAVTFYVRLYTDINISNTCSNVDHNHITYNWRMNFMTMIMYANINTITRKRTKFLRSLLYSTCLHDVSPHYELLHMLNDSLSG